MRKLRFPRLIRFPLILLLLGLPALGLAQQTFAVPFTYQIGGTVPKTAGYNITGDGLPLSLVRDSATWVTASLSTNVTPSVLTIGVNPAGLVAGRYTSVLQVTSGVESLIFNITLDVTAAANSLTLSSASFTFNAIAGGAAPASQTLGVTAQSSVSATAAVSEQSCTSSNWLSLSPTGNFTASSTNTSFTISVNATGLTAGTSCNGTISMAVASGTQTASVTLNVTSPTSTGLSLSPSSFTFSAVVGGGNPASQTLTVTSQTTTGAAAQASEQSCTSSNWLSLSPAGSFNASPANSVFTVAVNATGLAAGTQCTGTISITVGAGTQSVPVTLTVSSLGTGVLNLSSSSFTFTAIAGGGTPSSQTLGVTAASNTSATAQVSEQSCTGNNWLILSPTGSFTAGPTNTNFLVSVNPAGLSAGTSCTGTISMTVGAVTQTATVTLNVTGVTVVGVDVSLSAFTFTATAGAAAPPSQTFLVLAETSTDATAQVTEQSCINNNWLTLSPTGSFTASPFGTTFTFAVNQAGMSAGLTCNGTITIVSSFGTQTVQITLNVIAGSSAPLTLSPSSLTFSAVEGGDKPASQTLTVTAPYDSNATMQILEQSCSNRSWLSISPTGSFVAGQTASSFVVSVNQAGIPGGSTCNGTVSTVSASGVRTTTVSLTVAPATSTKLSANVGSLSFTGIVNGAPPAAQTLSITSPAVTSATVQATEQTCTDANWLTLTPGGTFTAGPTKKDFQVTVDQTGQTPGTVCTGAIAMTSPFGTQSVAVTLVVSTGSGGLPVVTATPTSLSFTYAVGDPIPTAQIVSITGAGASGLFAVDTASTGWLQVSPTCPAIAPCSTPTNGSFSLAVTVDPSAVNAGGPYLGTITVAGIGKATGTTKINVSLTVTAPIPSMSLITNGASFVTGPVAAGEIISIFGNAGAAIGPPTAVSLNGANCPAPCTAVPTSMGGVQVIFQPGGIAAPLTYVSSTQINALVPYEVLGGTSGQVQVKYLGQMSNPMTVQYTAAQPGIFTATGTGSGLASVQQYDEQGTYRGQNSSSNPAKAGWYLTLYVTGEGIIPAPAVTGKVTVGAGVVPLLGPPKLLIDSLVSTVTYFAEAAGFVSGLMQVNAIVPAGVHTAQAVPVMLSMSGSNSQPGVVLYIQ